MSENIQEYEDAVLCINRLKRDFESIIKTKQNTLKIFYNNYESMKDNNDHLKRLLFVMVNMLENNFPIKENELDIDMSTLSRDYIEYIETIKEDDDLWTIEYDYMNNPYIVVGDKRFCNAENNFECLVQTHNRIVTKCKGIDKKKLIDELVL